MDGHRLRHVDGDRVAVAHGRVGLDGGEAGQPDPAVVDQALHLGARVVGDFAGEELVEPQPVVLGPDLEDV